MTTTRRPLVAGNWKMNGLRADGAALASAVGEGVDGACDVALCPPATLLTTVAAVIEGSPVLLGGQDCATATHGAHTGDVAAPMLADAGCKMVILGHSERRHDHGENSALVRAKAQAAVAAGLAPIVCVGETEAERDAGRALAVVGQQLSESVPEGAPGLVVAYEPVWAIGTGRTASPDDVAEVHRHMRTCLSDMAGIDAPATRLLYGGSVKPGNAAELFAVTDVDGGLIGGAALKAEDFLAICQSAAQAV
ncbi:MAG: triose-phosphate isomerase [Alphaproteobacteria bacterium]|jgi:triosephosphate isomerase|nr:triose-phosphate isomerase [Alphaproteobacteria bacterium]